MTKARTVGAKRRGRREPEAVEARYAEPSIAPVMRPTPEAMRHGSYTQGRGDARLITNDASTLLGKLAVNGTITQRQRKGGEAFADTYRLAWSISGKDSCVLRVGGVGHETGTQAEKMIARKAKLNRVLNTCGPRAYSLLVQVGVFEQALGKDRGRRAADYGVFRLGLDACIEWFDVPA
jgi:hypothetical protein